MMNQIAKYQQLNNRYYGMRHGQSLANCQGLVVSTPENGIPRYGLSDEGKKQVERSIRSTRVLNEKTRIISSDFKRARETAEISQALLKTEQPVLLEAKLRERDFGDFELGPDTNYQKTWDNDAISSAHTFNHVESADAVMARATSLVASLEASYHGECFLLVAHGDTLQILQAAFYQYPASKQRELPHLETAEIRALVLSLSRTT